MKYLDEYRDAAAVRGYADALARLVTRPWVVMEICGGQTHSIVRFGLDRLLPEGLKLVHGPGCPVCVTPLETIDQALAIARLPNVTLCSFGDMLRVPGSDGDLLRARAMGADVRVVYSPLDSVEFARAHPDREVVFLAVGFETTAPANAIAVRRASDLGLTNFSVLVAQVCVPPAIEAILGSPDNQVQGFLAAGHVCAIMGSGEYPALSEKYRVPIVVTGFEPVDLLHGLTMCVRQLEEDRHEVENAYSRCVQAEGNLPAQALLAEVFQVIDRKWRGIGMIPRSGLGLRPEYERFDATRRFDLSLCSVEEPSECRAALVLQGLLEPHKCPAFGKRCTPENPLGAPMVSSEGACAAYYRYRSMELLEVEHQNV